MGRKDADDDNEAAAVTVTRIGPGEAQAAMRVAASIILALLLGGPGLYEAGIGRRDFASAAWWFFLSLTASRIAVTILWSVWAGYRRSIDDQHRERERDELAKELDRQRAERSRAVAEDFAQDIAASRGASQ
jgi:hypothetical protein